MLLARDEGTARRSFTEDDDLEDQSNQEADDMQAEDEEEEDAAENASVKESQGGQSKLPPWMKAENKPYLSKEER